MARVSVLIASSVEIKRSLLPAQSGPHQISVIYTGLGKIRACLAAYEGLRATPSELAINLGTCGSHTIPLGTVVEVSSYVERDVDLSVAGFQPGFFPGVEGKIISSKKYLKNLPQAICGTGDRIDLQPPRVICDVYDMEAFALAFVCQKLGVPFVSLKFVSDSSQKSVAAEWKNNLAKAQESLLIQLQEIINSIP